MIKDNLASVQARINKVNHTQVVTLIAVSKTKSASDVQQAIDAGQRHFGENYLQEALDKIAVLENAKVCWHFIGPIQSNKTKQIAQNFDWVHSVDRLKIAKRLNDQRPDSRGKLNVLLQVNIDHEPTKSGVSPEGIDAVVVQIKSLKKLSLKGFMCIPNPDNSRLSFIKMAEIGEKYPDLGMLSMGMSHDLELAIQNGATFVRVGSDIFGKRD